MLACTAGHGYFLLNPRTALAQVPAAAPSSAFPWPQPLTGLLDDVSEGITLCPTGLSMGLTWSKVTNFLITTHLFWSSEWEVKPLVPTIKPTCFYTSHDSVQLPVSPLSPQTSDISFHLRRAALIFMSRDMKTKQHQNKYFASPRKLRYKPLLHTALCKVQSTHQAQTKPWSHTLLGQKPHWIHPGVAAFEGNFLRARLTPIKETSICSPTFTPASITHATGTFQLAFAGKHPQI